MSLFPVTRAASLTSTFLLTTLPHGGQRTARRNAWAAMSADAVKARGRREADVAMAQAADRARGAGAQSVAQAR